MGKHPRGTEMPALKESSSGHSKAKSIGIVLSGGGSRAAYQVGALRALLTPLQQSENSISVIVGSSIGSVNGLILGSALKNGLGQSVDLLNELWVARNYRNTFAGSPSMAFVRAIRIAISQALKPGPTTTQKTVFDPTPLMTEVDDVIKAQGGLLPEKRARSLSAVAVMTTVDGSERKPLLFLSSKKDIDKELMQGASFEVEHTPELTAKHAFASAALPSILPPVEISSNQEVKVKLVDGGISQNVPVDPCVRLGAEEIIVVDISGRTWWFDHYHEPHDKRPSWEVKAKDYTFCFKPPQILYLSGKNSFGKVLKGCVGKHTSKFIRAVGPVWPLFSLLKNKLGEEAAFEAMSYVALDQEYLQGIIEMGYDETAKVLSLRNNKLF
jgi:predicted acylesterase/phospholipase RssA